VAFTNLVAKRLTVFFSQAEISRRAAIAKPIEERLASAGCRFVQIEAPDNNGCLRGKIVSLARGLSPHGTSLAKALLASKGGCNPCVAAPFANAANGWGKMMAVPDLSTAIALPWKSNVAAVLCDFYMDDGTPCRMDGRHILRSVEASIAKLGYSMHVALEYEVYIVKRNEGEALQGFAASSAAFGSDRVFYSLTRVPSFESLAKEFISRCEAAGIAVEAFHTEWGRGMFEYCIEPQTAVKAADDAVRAKLYLKELCAERGLEACFMAARFVGTGDSFCGCHHNLSLAQGNRNAFWDGSTGGLSVVARYAVAELLKTMPSFSLFFRPWVNSYRRMNRLLGAPENASWGLDNGYAAIRVVHGSVPEKMTRLEHRVAGADVNPYLSIAAIAVGCLRGLDAKQEPPPMASSDPTLESRWEALPRTLPDAINQFSQSAAALEGFGRDLIDHIVCIKQDEWKDFAAAVASPETALSAGPVTDWELDRYAAHV
jgi:glutamine synthetase